MKAVEQKERAFRAAVYEADGIGPVRFKLLLRYFGSAEAIWKADGRKLRQVGLCEDVVSEIEKRRKQIDPEKHLIALAKLGIKVVLRRDREYPRLLKEIENPPQVLFVKGYFRVEDDRALAVVGTRKPTGYGKEIARKLVEELCAAGFTIVSGLARGIDGIAHRTALECGGRTIAVLGGGVDRIYPGEHVGLASDISKHGAVISEFACGKLPVPGNFPARNRVISGLSLGVLVVEGAAKSGTKITAALAADQGREVFAVPGPITSRFSEAPVDLIKLGAKAVTGIEDVLQGLSLQEREKSVKCRIKKIPADLTEREKAVIGILKDGQLQIDELVKRMDCEVAEVSASLTLLELKGLVRHLGGMVYVVV